MPQRPPPPDLPTRRKIRRSTVYAVVGLAGIAYEALFAAQVRPTLLVVYIALCGLPPVTAANEAVKRMLREER